MFENMLRRYWNPARVASIRLEWQGSPDGVDVLVSVAQTNDG